MDRISPQQLRNWRQNAGISQEALGKLLGLAKIAVTKIENAQRRISEPEQKLLQLLILGNLPFHNSTIEAKTSELEFTPEQWQVIQTAATREGYDNAKDWIVDKIKSYLRMNPDSNADQIAAEAPDPYNKHGKK